MNKEELSERFISFAEKECKDSSRLYEFLSKQIADDHYMLDLCRYVRDGQPVPNMIFGAVHYLLLKGSTHELRKFYPSITPKPENPAMSFSAFRDFCKENERVMKGLLQTKLVQTNEVRRTGYLYPVFCHVYAKFKKPLALIEIGTSAGLQLFWDEYKYSYGGSAIYGNHQSNVHIATELKGGNLPFLYNESPPVSMRTGLDLHVNDLRDTEDYLWLNALIWPEHMERRKAFERASEFVRKNNPDLIEGDGVSMLPAIAAKAPTDAVVCIFHTHVANQMPREVKEDLLRTIERLSQTHDIAHIYNNIMDRDLHLDYFIEGEKFSQKVCQTDGHGRWFTWELEG